MDHRNSRDAAHTALEANCDRALRVPCYCEENVWRLAHRRLKNTEIQRQNYYVMFVSNEKQCVPMCHQLAREDDGPCFWDYHVILLETTNHTSLVWDMDSRLTFPCPLKEYLEETFLEQVPEEYQPLFR